MGDLTNNFSRKEFACKCGCGFDTVDFELLSGLQHYADNLKLLNPNKKIRAQVNSGCRCETYNTKIKGAKKSQHLKGRAADVRYYIDGVQIAPRIVAEYFHDAHPTFSTGIYNTFTHIDTRTGNPWRGGEGVAE